MNPEVFQKTVDKPLKKSYNYYVKEVITNEPRSFSKI